MGIYSNSSTVLVADDNTDDCLIAMVAWEESRSGADLRFVHNSMDLMDYLYHRGQYIDFSAFPRPELVMLDLSLPSKDGRQVLTEIQVDPILSQIPVVVFTTSEMPRALAPAENLGVYEFVRKPANIEEYLQVISELNSELVRI